MSTTTGEFCEVMADKFPDVSTILTEHVADNDELLPHVFLADVTRYILGDGQYRAPIVEFLDESFGTMGPDVEELIAVSFVEYLVTSEELALATKGVRAPRILAEWNRQRAT